MTTAEEHNINLPELPSYLRLQIENGSKPNEFTSTKAYLPPPPPNPAILLKACDLLHCELEDQFNERIPSVFPIKIKQTTTAPDKCSKWSWMEEWNKFFYEDVNMLALMKYFQLYKM